MRIAVCDDCYEDAVRLKNFLAGHEVRLYYDAQGLLADLEEEHLDYDLYLLDIYMDGSISGIELAKELRAKKEEVFIVFVSSSDDFYREAYDLYAFQYLLKPVREKELKQLLDKVAKNLLRDKERSLCYKWRGQSGTIPFGNILFVSSREHTIFIQCKDGKVQECKGKLSEIALQICGDVFLRCHQSFLVNMYQVDGMNGNELAISGHHIPISRRYFADVKNRYQEILFEEVD